MTTLNTKNTNTNPDGEDIVDLTDEAVAMPDTPEDVAEPRTPRPIPNGWNTFTSIIEECVRSGENEPQVCQDGGYEIHPILKGITFNFWHPPNEKSKNYGKCAVNWEGQADNELGRNIAYGLTGLAFDGGFGAAKGYLRAKAKEMVEEDEARQAREKDAADAANIRKSLN